MITTKFLGPTNHRQSRVKATLETPCKSVSVTVNWNHSTDIYENHRAAALAVVANWDAANTEYAGLRGTTWTAHADASAGYVFMTLGSFETFEA